MKTSYKIDPAHSSAQFSVRHMMITNVRGGFSSVNGTAVFDPDNLNQSSIDAVIDAGSIKTLDEQRDAHLKGADFLDVEKYPTITFKSKKVEPGKIAGDLTIHGVTKEIALNLDGPTGEEKDPWGNVRIGASASTKIRRSDFGLTWNSALETGGLLVGDDLKLDLEISLIKAQ